MWQFAPNSVHYLLSLWQRMVASVPYVKAKEPHLLETYTPEVTNAYITSRLESVAVVVRYFTRISSFSTEAMQKLPYTYTYHCFSREGLEDPLDDLGMVHQQLEQLSVIGRCEYQKTCALLVTLFDQAARLYQELISTPTSVQIDISIQEGNHCFPFLSYLTYFNLIYLWFILGVSLVFFLRPPYLVSVHNWISHQR